MLCFPSYRKFFVVIRLLGGRTPAGILGLRRRLDTFMPYNQCNLVTPLGRWTRLATLPCLVRGFLCSIFVELHS